VEAWPLGSPDVSDRDDHDYPESRRLLAAFHALAMGAWRIEEALRILAERRPARRDPLDSPSGFHRR
jgi:hypothetical protein